PMEDVTRQIADAKTALQARGTRDLWRGFSRTFLLIAAGLWLIALAMLVYLADRISRPIRQLTQGLGRVAEGDLGIRVPSETSDEIGAAMQAFNHMAGQLETSQERLVQVTRLSSWQALARKMAHEVKNSLTPIRLTVEEVVSRKGSSDTAFLEQAAQIVTD